MYRTPEDLPELQIRLAGLGGPAKIGLESLRVCQAPSGAMLLASEACGQSDGLRKVRSLPGCHVPHSLLTYQLCSPAFSTFFKIYLLYFFGCVGS